MVQSTLKDDRYVAHIVRVRVVMAALAVLLGCGILIFRLAYLQIVQYEKFTTASEANRIKLQPVAPTRGLIFDRNGVLLADNQPSFTLVIKPKVVTDLQLALDKLDNIIRIDPDERERFSRRLKRSRRPDDGVPIKFNLTEEQIATLAVNQHILEGVEVQAELIRHYPHPELTAHVVGYVGRINQREEATIDKAAYAGISHIGKTGVEYAYEHKLLGEIGFQRVETDALGRVSRVLERFAPTPGENLQLFLDLRVQKAAQQAMAGRRGSIVALELPTGGIVSMVSTPSFDSNLFVQGIDQASFDLLNLSIDRPLYNRALKGQYPPGSTIKPMVALGAIENNIMDWNYEILDPGFYRLEGDDHMYRDWKKGGHGRVDMRRAIVQSCDTYFYELSRRMGVDLMHDFLSEFGLGAPTGVDLNYERKGLLPSRQWKLQQQGMVWFPGETLIMGIGQGFMLATPIQLAYMTAMMATNGQTSRPRIWQKAPVQYAKLPVGALDQSANGSVAGVEPIAQSGPRKLWQEQNWLRVVKAMEDVVHGSEGTARRVGNEATYRMAGKTGTAQVISIAQDAEYDAESLEERHRDHALFIAFAPVDNPLIAVAVIVENGGSGSSTAAPVAKAVIDAYLLGARS